MEKFKFREIRKGEKLKKGTVLTHKSNQKDRLVVTRNHDGGKYSLFVKFVDRDFEYSNQFVSQYLIVFTKPETAKQTIKRLTAQLAESAAKNETDKKSFDERLAYLDKCNSDRVKYYENRIAEITKMHSDESKTRREAQISADRLSRQVGAMKQTILHLGAAVESASGIGQV